MGSLMIHERLTRVKQWMIEIVWDREDDCFVDKLFRIVGFNIGIVVRGT